ncbi:MAG: DUF2892 domain-containing protein [Halobacteria archaeon]
MSRNLGSLDRKFRVFVGFLIMSIGGFLYYVSLMTELVLSIVLIGGTALAVTGLIAWCPVYSYIGEDTQVMEEI